MMIQSISATRAAAASAESALPVAARANHGQATAGRSMADDAMRGFGERMLLASTQGEDPSAEFPTVSLPGTLPVLLAEQGQVSQVGGSASQGSETPQELTPEQWLLGMIDQQLAEIQARDAAQLGTVPEPVPQALPTAEEPAPALQVLPVATASPADELLAWAQAQSVADQHDQTYPSEALMAGGFQRHAAEASLMTPAMPRPTGEMSLGLPVAAPALVDTRATSSLEPLLDAIEPLDAGEPLTSTVERGQTTPAQAADRALKLQAPEAKWGEQMLHALRENVDLQIQQKIQSATIRLDPPELGSMEIMLSHESGRLNIQLSAANADVARLLQQTSDRLRQELVGQHFVQVNVQVGADSGGQQRQRAALAGEELPTAARQEEQQQSRDSGRARDVLITV